MLNNESIFLTKIIGSLSNLVVCSFIWILFCDRCNKRESILCDDYLQNHGCWYLVLWWALTVNVGSSWMHTTRTLAIQYRISEVWIFKVRYCEMLRSELSVHRNSFNPRLDAVEFFVADTGFCWVGTLSGASGSCLTILVGSDTVKVRSDPTKIKVGYW